MLGVGATVVAASAAIAMAEQAMTEWLIFMIRHLRKQRLDGQAHLNVQAAEKFQES
jgi:hypothetical protein